MALTDNPYLPLYVKDWMTSNKLKLCSAQAHGIMINIMCLMHRENQYGVILLKQNFKQSDNQTLNFAYLLAKLLPFSETEINSGLIELLEEKCLRISDDRLICDRMVSDASLSEMRSKTGKKGGDKTATKFAKAKVQPKLQANTGIGNAIGIKNTNAEKTKFDLAFDAFLEMRKKQKKPPTPYAIKLIKDKLEKLSSGDIDTQIEIINRSTTNCWQDVFALKKETAASESKPNLFPQNKTYKTI